MNQTTAPSPLIPSEQWGVFFDQFSTTHRGRSISIEVIDPVNGDQEVVHKAPLLVVIYDRPGKGNNIMIEVGQDEVAYAHTIAAPAEVLTRQNSEGVLTALLITDGVGTKTLLQFQEP